MKYRVENSKEFGGKFITYAQWTGWRCVNKKKYNEYLDPAVVKFETEVIGAVVDLETGELKNEDGGKQHPKFQQLISFIEQIIFDWGFGMAIRDGFHKTSNQPSAFEEIVNDIYAGQLQEIKKDWSQIIFGLSFRYQ